MTSMKNFLKFKTRQNSSDLRKFGEEYYLREARLWRPFRLFGLFATISAMIFILWAIGSSEWIYGKGRKLFPLIIIIYVIYDSVLVYLKQTSLLD
ncbi:endoglucanase [Elysia marginata]|uniref:Endoglucanase n=1 Tax=Elysia marginata TaxID=1093978 RepID=A0AAV4IXU7_9GAST|nr:endoglucanase [Elysia marginata]